MMHLKFPFKQQRIVFTQILSRFYFFTFLQRKLCKVKYYTIQYTSYLGTLLISCMYEK